MIFKSSTAGFTLLELSIVIVIIALVIGAIFIGQNLINASQIRSQITQIDKYNSAVNTFKVKYNTIPGDLDAATANVYGFSARGAYPGQGDNNGKIEGFSAASCASGCNEGASQAGEILLFWNDLSTAQLIDGSFTSASANVLTNSANVSIYLPKAKLGQNAYVAVWSGGTLATGNSINSNGINYFSLSSITAIGPLYALAATSPTLPVSTAYSIDQKMDDGFPQSGNVTASYVTNVGGYYGLWAGAASGANGVTTTATPASNTTCYDNANIAGATQQYSIRINSGNSTNCALSFKFQ